MGVLHSPVTDKDITGANRDSQPDLGAFEFSSNVMNGPILISDNSFNPPSVLNHSTGPTPVLIWYLDSQGTSYSGNLDRLVFDVVLTDPNDELSGALIYDLSTSQLVSNTPTFSSDKITFDSLSWPISSSSNSHLELKITTFGLFSSNQIEFQLVSTNVIMEDGAAVTGGNVISGPISLVGPVHNNPKLEVDSSFTAPANITKGSVDNAVLRWMFNSGGNGELLDGFTIDVISDVSDISWAKIYELNSGNLIYSGDEASGNVISGNLDFFGNPMFAVSENTYAFELRVDVESLTNSDNLEFNVRDINVHLSGNHAGGGVVHSGVIPFVEDMARPFLVSDSGFTPPSSIHSNQANVSVFAFELDSVSNGYSGEITELRFGVGNADPNQDFLGFGLRDIVSGVNISVSSNIVGGNIVFDALDIFLSSSTNTKIELKASTSNTFVSGHVDFSLDPMGFVLVDGGKTFGSKVSYGSTNLLNTGGLRLQNFIPKRIVASLSQLNWWKGSLQR